MRVRDIALSFYPDLLKGVMAGFVSFAGSWFLPVSKFIAAITILIIADYITGTKAAKKKGERISSRGMRRTVEKIFYYFAAIMLTHMTQQIFFPWFPLVYPLVIFIAWTELRSTLENISEVTGNNVAAVVINRIFKKIPWIKELETELKKKDEKD